MFTLNVVYKRSLAVQYLTDAFNMGYAEASFELARAHQALARWYSSEGGKELYQRLVGSK